MTRAACAKIIIDQGAALVGLLVCLTASVAMYLSRGRDATEEEAADFTAACDDVTACAQRILDRLAA